MADARGPVAQTRCRWARLLVALAPVEERCWRGLPVGPTRPQRSALRGQRPSGRRLQGTLPSVHRRRREGRLGGGEEDEGLGAGRLDGRVSSSEDVQTPSFKRKVSSNRL